MLYKNKKNVLRGVVAFVFMLTLSLSTALSPLAKAEEAKYTWKTLTSAPATNRATNRKKGFMLVQTAQSFLPQS